MTTYLDLLRLLQAQGRAETDVDRRRSWAVMVDAVHRLAEGASPDGQAEAHQRLPSEATP